MKARERRLSVVPRAVLALLAVSLAAQIAWRTSSSGGRTDSAELPQAASMPALRLASFGEPTALGKILMLYLQSVDFQAGSRIPYRNLDYDRLIAWLSRILELDPKGQYPLVAASRLYAEVPDPERQKKMLEFVHRQFFADPNRRWPWLAHAAAIAKHELKDLPLALRYATAIETYATDAHVPLWAKQMRAFILEDMNELDMARSIIGGYITNGNIDDPRELRFLENRLRQIEERQKARH